MDLTFVNRIGKWGEKALCLPLPHWLPDQLPIKNGQACEGKAKITDDGKVEITITLEPEKVA